MPSEEQSVPEEKPPLKRNLPLAVVSLALATALTGTIHADVEAMITNGRLDRRLFDLSPHLCNKSFADEVKRVIAKGRLTRRWPPARGRSRR